MVDFDDILKKGKQAAGPAKDKRLDWKMAIGAVLNALQDLNALYGNDTCHYIYNMERGKCATCGKVTYMLNVYDIDSINTQLKFHLSDWKTSGSSGYSTYYCGACHKP